MPEVVLQHCCLLGESPVWDCKQRRILWIDILQKEIHQFYPTNGTHLILQLEQVPGAIALRKAGGLVAALNNGFSVIDIDNGIVETWIDAESHLPCNRFNDGKCDPAGRFWAGTMEMSGKKNHGNLYTLEKDLSIAVKLKSISCSNGLAWSLDHKTMYFIDTPLRQVAAFNYDISSGQIKNKRVIIHIPQKEGLPDGMTIDSEGMLWIALFNGGKVTRWDPDTGELLYKIFLPVSKVTSCCFGGENLEDLYITSAKIGLRESDLKDQPLAGSMFVMNHCGFKGVPSFEFDG